MKFNAKKTTFIIIGFFFIACHSSKGKKEIIKVATAANAQFAMDSIVHVFSEKNNCIVNLIVSSSGKLKAQIQSGAPYQIFVSANLKYPNALYAAGFSKDTAKVYAQGVLVLWTLNKNIKPDLQMLTSKNIHHIAIANPETAPYGAAAIQVLKSAGLYEKVKSKLVYGESISQVNQYVVSKTADIGFTAKSVVMSPEMSGKGKWNIIKQSEYKPIQQGAIIVAQKSAKISVKVQKLFDFLFSKNGQAILKSFGYQYSGS